jgi:hypothetical protein
MEEVDQERISKWQKIPSAEWKLTKTRLRQKVITRVRHITSVQLRANRHLKESRGSTPRRPLPTLIAISLPMRDKPAADVAKNSVHYPELQYLQGEVGNAYRKKP